MSEVEIGGLKLKGGKGLAFLMAIGSLIGVLYGGFEVYKDYMDMKEKLANLDPDAIEARLDTAMVELNTAIDYARDIKDDLRSDVIQVEKALSDVEQRIRETERENRELVSTNTQQMRTMIDDHQAWFITRQADIETAIRAARQYFDERTNQVDEKLQTLEDRLNERLQRALDNPLVNQ